MCNVIYLAFMEKYNQDPKGVGVKQTVKHIIPYSLSTMAMWIVLLVLTYLIGLPTGIGASPILS